MSLHFYKPSPRLHGYVKHYLYYQINGECFSQPIKFFPSGNPYIVFNFDAPFFIYNSSNIDGALQKGNIVVGQQESYYLLSPGRKWANFCVIFTPTGFYRLFGHSLNETINNSFPMEFMIKNDIVKKIEDIGSEIKNPELMVRLLDHFFCKRLREYYPSFSYVDASVHIIKDRKGMITVKELANLCNTSERNYRRRFLDIVGLPPKKYIRITRFWNIFRILNSGSSQRINWSDITYNLGYYDQMHFIKEFKNFCGESPGIYFSDYNKDEKSLERDLLHVTT
jgi:AraC-like DNA-binding protein